MLARRIVVECFMRSFGVERGAENIKAALLGGKRSLRWPRRLCLEGSMHPLMAPVLLRGGRFDPVVTNAELHPIDTQTREPVNGPRGKRNAVISADDQRKSVLLEESREGALGRLMLGRWQCFTAQDKAGEPITDGQRIAVVPIAKQELALKVRRPDVIRRIRFEGRGTGIIRLAPLRPPRAHQAMAFKQIADRADGRKTDVLVPTLEVGDELARSPGRMIPPGRQKQFSHRLRHRVRRSPRGTAPVGQGRQATFPEPIQPLVSSLSTDTIELAKLGHRVRAFVIGNDKSCTFVHGFSLMPRHGSASWFDHAVRLCKLLPMLPV